jgi:diguanylate cyclase (GGDEF)-like protein
MVDLYNSEIINTDKIEIDSDKYFELSTSAIDEIYNLLIYESDVVSDISSQDINALLLKRNLIILFTVMTILIILYLFAGFYQSIRGGISAIEIATRKIANGDLSERVQLEAIDETLKIQNALNKMADTLIANYKQVSEAKSALEKVAHYDHLTGLPNRALFMEKLNEAISEAHRTSRTTALMFIDLDRFKRINDTLGHQMGDVVLKSVAVQLTGIVGDKGTICRLGGDEFTILLPEIKTKEEVERLSKKITEVIERPWVLNEEEHSIGASIGYTFYPCEAKDAEDMLRKADMAMYETKQKRKERFGREVR